MKNNSEVNMPYTRQDISLRSLAWQSFKIGCLGFGGPVGQISLMHRIFVDEKKWIDEAHYLHALNYCMLLPGPEAQQLAVYVGWLLRGVRGGIISGLLFIIPGMVIILGLAWLYVSYADLPALEAFFFGIKAAVLAIITHAIFKMSGRALKARFDYSIALAAFLALSVFGIPFPFVIFSAAIIGLFFADKKRQPISVGHKSENVKNNDTYKALYTSFFWLVIWILPVLLAWLALGNDNILVRIGILFSKLAMITFGGAYAVLAYLQQQAVFVEGWITASQMIDGLGLAETTPGPLVLVNQFIGFISGWNAQGEISFALLCALMAGWCTFVPSFLWIFAGAPFAEKLRHNNYVMGVLRYITAAVLGVITSLCFWLGLQIIFVRTVTTTMPWGNDISLPIFESIDLFSSVSFLLASFMLIKLKLNIIYVIVFCIIIGFFKDTLF